MNVINLPVCQQTGLKPKIMTKNYTFVPVFLLIMLAAILLGGKAKAQNIQKKVKVVAIKSNEDCTQADTLCKEICIQKFYIDDDHSFLENVNIDSLINIHCKKSNGLDEPKVQIIKIINGDTLINQQWSDSLERVFLENFESDSLHMLLKNMDENFDFITEFDAFIDPLNLMNIDIESFFNETEGTHFSKDIEVIVNATGKEAESLIFISDDGENISIERNGEVVFINKGDNVKDINSKLEVIENEDEQVLVLQTKIVLDKLNKTEQKELKSKGLKTSEKEIDYEYLKFYPNPSYGEFNVQFQLAKPGNVEVKISNMLGKIVFHEQRLNFKGEYQKAIDLKPYGAGNYILQIIQGDRVISRKIIVE